MDQFESFETKRFVQRLLGKGDVSGLMDKIQVGEADWGVVWGDWRGLRVQTHRIGRGAGATIRFLA